MLNDKILFIKELLVPVFTYSSAQSLMELHKNPNAQISVRNEIQAN